jgi:hypothetical protein
LVDGFEQHFAEPGSDDLESGLNALDLMAADVVGAEGGVRETSDLVADGAAGRGVVGVGIGSVEQLGGFLQGGGWLVVAVETGAGGDEEDVPLTALAARYSLDDVEHCRLLRLACICVLARAILAVGPYG